MHTHLFYSNSTHRVSDREREVLELLSNGHSSTEIATTLYLSPHTVNDHRKSLKWKLDAKNVAQMIRRGFMKTTLYTLLAFCFLSQVEIHAQGPTNANRYNVTVFTTGYYYGFDDNGSSINYPTFAMKGRMDSNGSADHLINTRGDNASHRRWWDSDTPSTKGSGWRQVIYATNTPYSYGEVTSVSFDNNCGSRSTYQSSCGFFSNDGTSYRMSRRVNGRRGETGVHFDHGYSSHSNNRMRVRHTTTWRFYNGQGRTRPLTFGTIPDNGRRTHTNYNRAAPSNIARDGFSGATTLGYINNWGTSHSSAFSNAPDVTYSFSVDQLSRVDANTNFSTTNYNSKVHIVKKVGASGFEIIASNSSADVSTNKARVITYIEPGDYFVVVEGDGSSTGKFFLDLRINHETMTAGTIDHPMPWVNKDCKLTIPIEGDVATSSFAPVTYDWYQIINREVEGSVDTNIILHRNAGPLMSPELAGNIEWETRFVRVAHSANIVRQAADTVTIEPIGFAEQYNNGIIKGRVTGRDGSSGVAGIAVIAVPDANIHGNCQIYTDTTDQNGNYEITDIYYGKNGEFQDIPNGDYKVYPNFEDHIFEPDTLLAQGFSQNARTKSPIDFKDITTFFIRGRVTQSDANSDPNEVCGVPGVRMYLKEVDAPTGEISLWTTDENGNYSIAVQNQGKHVVRPEFLDHGFTPDRSDTINVISNVEGIDFQDTSRQMLTGSVKACGGYDFGSVELSIEDTLGCFKYRIVTDASGNFEIEVPANVYYISITEEPIVDAAEGYRIEDVIAFFNRATQVDLSEEDQTLDLVYRQKPIINVVGIPTNSCGVMVMDQLQEYELFIEITETNTDGCPLDTGSVIIIDQISRDTQITLPISNGLVRYTVEADEPNFVGDFKKLLSITARHLQDSTYENTTVEKRVVVTGAKQRQGTFTTVSPEVPFFILRDPPGDGSYSYIEEQTSSQLSVGFSNLVGGSVNVWQKARLGTTFEAGFLGFSTETDVWGEIGSSTTVSASSRTTTEGVLSFSNSARYETSSDPDPDVMGQGGDLYVGAAMTLRYAKADILSLDSDACEPEKTVEVIMGDTDLSTKYVYTEFNIINSIIPSLESLRDLEEDPIEVVYYQDQIDVWNQVLEQNRILKRDALPNSAFPINGDDQSSSISWSGGTTQEYTATSTSSATIAIEFNLEIDRELSAEVGLEVAGSGRSGGGFIRTRMEIGGGVSASFLSSSTTGFVLTDDDNLDRFETTVLRDPVYNTPIFRNDAAITSCPYEPGTSPIDGPVLEALTPIDNNIPPDGNAGFRFRISNNSQDEKTRSYYLDVVESSNPNNAKINAALPILFEDMDYEESRERFISVSREGADPDVYSYEGLEFILYPAECAANGEYATSTARVSAYFNSTCSDVSMAEPQQGWSTNGQDNNIRRVWIKDYEEDQLSDITIQYAKAGKDSWSTAEGPLTADDLNDNGTNGTYVDWNVTNLEDGEYDLRLKLTCGGGTIYTGRVRGVVDRSAPIVFGIPEPIDDIYVSEAEDDITVKMTEDVDCVDANVTLQDLETGEYLNANMTCVGNEIDITPVDFLENRAPSAYRVSITGLKDAVENVSDPVNWLFIVGEYEYSPDCSPVMISNNNVDQDAISQSVYRSMQISSDGTVAQASTIGYKAEESVSLEPGFTVNTGGELEANIENCVND